MSTENKSEDHPELCINAQTLNDDRDFYCHYYKKYKSCKFPSCKHYIHFEKRIKNVR